MKERVLLISPVQCDFFVEGCLVALSNQNHQSGVVLKVKVEGDEQETFELIWDKHSFLSSGWQESRDVVENGAIAIAFF